MAQNRRVQAEAVKDGSLSPLGDGASRLWKCVAYSGLVHAGFIWSLWVLPHLPLRAAPPYPVYTVELIGGEKLGGTTLGTELRRPKPKKEPKKVKVEPRPQVEPAKTEPLKKEEVVVKEQPKKEESKPVEKRPVMEEIAKPQKLKAELKPQAPTAEGLPEDVRERLIQAALQRVRKRAEASRKAQAAKEAPKPEKKEVVSAGPGEGVGAAALGTGVTGGGIVKAFEFLVYRNQMLRLIRDRWTWMGGKSDLEVTVQFGIQENGQIAGLRIVRVSGDPSYDDSVLRAVTKASPLPPPPESYRREFMNVELTFRPKDLGG